MNFDRPVISVCILTYNHEDYLRQCIESILVQQVEVKWEIIISDDCSTDQSLKIIEEYYDRYSELIRVINSPKNVGVIKSLINLLKASTGKYIAICEGDDYWTDRLKLKKQLSILETHTEYSMVCSNRSILSMDGVLSLDMAYKKDIYTTADILEGFIPGTQTMMFRNQTSLVDFLKNYHYIFSGDRYLSYFCSLFGRIYRMSDSTAVYRLTSTGIWSQIPLIEKLIKSSVQLEEFHISIGLPINNSILAEKAFNTSFSLFLYCLKRPKLLISKSYLHFILKPFTRYSKMNRLKYLAKAIFHRINPIAR
jgi:glycosyltransferase involved in cell wall biosynthesis